MLPTDLPGIPEMKGKGEGLNWQHLGPFPPHTVRMKLQVNIWVTAIHGIRGPEILLLSCILQTFQRAKEPQIPPIPWPAQTSQVSAETVFGKVWNRVWTLGKSGVLVFQEMLVLEEDSQPGVVCVTQGLPHCQGSRKVHPNELCYLPDWQRHCCSNI